jgi:A/G-specific adenine glycosylase
MAPTEISERLLAWYDAEHRALPWRTPPGATARPDPYRVWLSEIMLQQTTVAAVIPYFEAFTRRWPTVEALAAAADADVMAAWAGLGYYARARNLLACARAVAGQHGGRFPEDEAELRALAGIGAYTAAAIAAIAFDRPATAVDGNVERVAARLFAVQTPLPAAKPVLRRLAATLTPSVRSGDFAQAMMDLGATICRPRRPLCAACPLAGLCEAETRGIADQIPVKAVKRARPVRYGNAYWMERDESVFVVRRPARGLLGGMLALPASEFAASPIPAGEFPGAPRDHGWRGPSARVRHVFTHFELQLDVFVAVSGEPGVRADGHWLAHDHLLHSGLPTVFRKAVESMLLMSDRKMLAL